MIDLLLNTKYRCFVNTRPIIILRIKTGRFNDEMAEKWAGGGSKFVPNLTKVCYALGLKTLAFRMKMFSLYITASHVIYMFIRINSFGKLLMHTRTRFRDLCDTIVQGSALPDWANEALPWFNRLRLTMYLLLNGRNPATQATFGKIKGNSPAERYISMNQSN